MNDDLKTTDYRRRCCGSAEKYRTAPQLIEEGVFPVAEAVLLRCAREHRVGKMMGRTRIFSEADCRSLYEALPCHSTSFHLGKENHRTGQSVERTLASELTELRELLTEKSRRKPSQNFARSASFDVYQPKPDQPMATDWPRRRRENVRGRSVQICRKWRRDAVRFWSS